jgi:hypothetical protein
VGTDLRWGSSWRQAGRVLYIIYAFPNTFASVYM